MNVKERESSLSLIVWYSVREACINGLEVLCIRLSDECPQLLTVD